MYAVCVCPSLSGCVSWFGAHVDITAEPWLAGNTVCVCLRVYYFVTWPILTNSACRASSFLRADFGDSGSTSLKDRRFNMFWGEKGT